MFWRIKYIRRKAVSARICVLWDFAADASG